MPSPRFKLVVALMSVLTVGTYLAEPYVGARSFEELRPAPTFTLGTLNGSTFNMARVDGAPAVLVAAANGTTANLSARPGGTAVLIDFMATWCPPCREEIRQLALVRSVYPPSRLQILTVDVDYSETPQELKDWLHAYSAFNETHEDRGWYFAMDTRGEFVGPRYGANALPTLVLVDGEGRVRRTWVGTVTAADLEVAIDAALTAVG